MGSRGVIGGLLNPRTLITLVGFTRTEVRGVPGGEGSLGSACARFAVASSSESSAVEQQKNLKIRLK